jgi:hypothetical protein
MDATPGLLNRLRIVWAEGRCALGAIATIPSIQTVQILARSGLDFIIIDMEHGPIGPAEAHDMIVATGGTQLVPLARIAATTAWSSQAAARPWRDGRLLSADLEAGRRRSSCPSGALPAIGGTRLGAILRTAPMGPFGP